MNLTINLTDKKEAVSAIQIIEAIYPDLKAVLTPSQDAKPAKKKSRPVKKDENVPPPHTDDDAPPTGGADKVAVDEPRVDPEVPEPEVVEVTVEQLQEMAKSYLTGVDKPSLQDEKKAIIDLLLSNFGVASSANLKPEDVTPAYNLIETYIASK